MFNHRAILLAVLATGTVAATLTNAGSVLLHGSTVASPVALEPPSPDVVDLVAADTGQSLWVRRGNTINVTLEGTRKSPWALIKSSKPKTLQLVSSSVQNGTATATFLVPVIGSGALTTSLLSSRVGQAFRVDLTVANPPPADCNHTGVIKTRNTQHPYIFAPLHVGEAGRIKGSNDCEIYFAGMNAINGMLGAPGGDGLIPAERAQLPFNVARISVNGRWYINNSIIYPSKIGYRQWLHTAIATLENNGIYPMINMTNNFFEVPCDTRKHGPGSHLCASEYQGELDYTTAKNNGASDQQLDHLAQGLQMSQAPAVQALDMLAQDFGQDSAVIFDVWNEPGPFVGIIPGWEKTVVPYMNQRIDTVRSHTANLVLAFAYGFPDFMHRKVPLYSQPNVVMDFHAYDNSWQVGPNFFKIMGLLHSHGLAATHGEWGNQAQGAKGIPSQAFIDQLIKAESLDHAGLIYNQIGYLFDYQQRPKPGFARIAAASRAIIGAGFQGDGGNPR